MASSLTIKLEQSRVYLAGDTAELEVDGDLQPDSWLLWGPERNLLDVDSPSLGFGRGAFGRGGFGVGAYVLTFLTLNAFVAGDYTIRVRARDKIGNVDGWSDPVVHEHRPVPPPPHDLVITAGELHWQWSDPA